MTLMCSNYIKENSYEPSERDTLGGGEGGGGLGGGEKAEEDWEEGD